MTRKKATIILEGNEVAIQRAIHELQKLTSEANRQPELTATMQTESLADDPHYGETFDPASNQE